MIFNWKIEAQYRRFYLINNDENDNYILSEFEVEYEVMVQIILLYLE